MDKAYTKPVAERLEFDYTEVVTASHDPADNPAGKGFAQDGCNSGHPSGKTFSNGQGC